MQWRGAMGSGEKGRYLCLLKPQQNAVIALLETGNARLLHYTGSHNLILSRSMLEAAMSSQSRGASWRFVYRWESELFGDEGGPRVG